MLEKALDKSAKIAVVDASAATRQLLSETVKSFGFSQINGMPGVKDVSEFLETDTLDLVICPLESGGEYNALSLLTLVTQNPNLRNIRVVLLADEDEQYCLPAAFSLGLLGVIAKPFTKDSIRQAFSQFINTVERHKGNEALVAGEYLRPILRKNKDFPAWMDFEKKLLKLFPGQPDLMLNLAEAQLGAGKKAEAITVLNQALLIDPKAEEKANAVFKPHAQAGETIKSALASVGGAAGFNALGIDRVVIVDKDEAIQNSLKGIFTDIGAKDIQFFNDGEAAAEYIKANPDPSLVIQEWRIPKLSGPLFVQRITREGATSSVIIVLSSLVQAKDMPLVREMGVSNIIEKPFDKSEFMKALIWTMQQDRIPSDQTALEIKIRRLLRARKKSEVEPLLARYLEDPKISEARKFLMQAEWDYVNKQYESVKIKCTHSLKSATDTVAALSLLGKALMQLRDFENALKCLEKAQSMSPQNVERLCQISEAESEMGKQKAAESTLDDAKDLDQNNPVVAETEIKLAINDNDTERAKAVMDGLESIDNIVGQMNNKAVALARMDRFEDSLKEYEKTVASIPESKPVLKSVVLYNLALALARAGRLEEAQTRIIETLTHASNKIVARAQSLKSRLELSISRGVALQIMAAPTTENVPLPAADAPGTPGTEELPKLSQHFVSEILPNPGEIGCYMIFSVLKVDDKVKTLLAKQITFSARKGIERAETGKGEAGLLRGA